MKIEFENFQEFASQDTTIGMSLMSMQQAIASAKNDFDRNKSFHNALQGSFESYTQIVCCCENLKIGIEHYKPFIWWCSQFIKDDIFLNVVEAYTPKLKSNYEELHKYLGKGK